MQNPPRTTFPDDLAALMPRYDGFLLDQWGVLHDGVRPYSDAVAALEMLRRVGKRVIILSNSGRSGVENVQQLAKFGFARELYDEVISAGDDARDALAARDEPFHQALGRRCLLLAREGEAHLAEGLGLDLVDDVEAADFILLMTMDPPRQSVTGWMTLLEAASERRLPLVCANPDLHRASPSGGLQEAPGLVARAYEQLGGAVRYHGKPQPRIYRTCLTKLGLDRSRVVAIGDSLEHDIAGAQGAGIDSVFIAGGIHRGEIGWDDAVMDRASCLALFARAGRSPTYVLPLLG
ncbi:MAG: TIGR01459 family HAD-type hydrolase [Bosea sp.]|uniref:TIGR01459 family HAD-type hydrolase n=1 Tax=Bosea sp. (in: a-proteobacteria) TaxID=1871050 RepID=UPI00239585CC|nr:TIGR01459 family HAD-type hydrolase [Bosea sp. (in: a-proteobacteria)]MCP4740320.1 TIGR01459 family HAD-type hydrolase [Bosea sp. (in: a-proteobacteria)]